MPKLATVGANDPQGKAITSQAVAVPTFVHPKLMDEEVMGPTTGKVGCGQVGKVLNK